MHIAYPSTSNADFRIIIDNTAKFVAELFSDAADGHDWWHTHRVWQLARQIAFAEGNTNLFIIELAALLHDVDDWKLFPNDAKELTKTCQWLNKQPITDDIQQAVIEIIKNLSFKGANTAKASLSPEGQIVQDADRLDAMGAIGIARTFMYSGSKNIPMYNPTLQPVMHQSYEQYQAHQGTAINHFHEKLLLLKDRLNTRSARKIAEYRHTIMVKFLQDFNDEWYFSNSKS